jgi:hypothetical protein
MMITPNNLYFVNNILQKVFLRAILIHTSSMSLIIKILQKIKSSKLFKRFLSMSTDEKTYIAILFEL